MKKLLKKHKILFISHVNPYIKVAGQNLRVANTLKAFNEVFEVHLLTLNHKNILKAPNQFCEKHIILNKKYHKKSILYPYYLMLSYIYSFYTSLKRSNYIIGNIEFRLQRIRKHIDLNYKFVIFEYWHGYKLVPYFRENGVKTICDTHNLLWQTYKSKLNSTKIPSFFKKYIIKKYKKFEENVALKTFDELIAINQIEYDYFKNLFPKKNNHLCGMGVNLDKWDYCWSIQKKPIILFYGGLEVKYNQDSAFFIYEKVFKELRKTFQSLEYWIIGNNPPEKLKNLAKINNIKVTGFVENPSKYFKIASLAVIPWKGTYGFRGRIIEIMSIGTPVLTTRDAVYGMGFSNMNNLIYVNDDSANEWRDKIRYCLSNKNEMKSISENAKMFVKENYSLDSTYKELTKKII